MEDENIYLGSGRDGDSDTDNNPEVSKTIRRNDVDFPADETKRTVGGVKHLVVGFFLSLLSFLAAVWLMSYFDVGYVIKALAAITFSILVIKAYDKATGELPTPKSGAVSNFTIILFILCLFTGYQNSNGKSAGVVFDKIFFAKLNEPAFIEEAKGKKLSSSESGTIRVVGEVWFANHIFTKGDKVKIIVEYNAVLMTGGRVFQPGVYKNEVVNDNGQIMFEGVSDNPSKVTVVY